MNLGICNLLNIYNKMFIKITWELLGNDPLLIESLGYVIFPLQWDNFHQSSNHIIHFKHPNIRKVASGIFQYCPCFHFEFQAFHFYYFNFSIFVIKKIHLINSSIPSIALGLHIFSVNNYIHLCISCPNEIIFLHFCSF